MRFFRAVHKTIKSPFYIFEKRVFLVLSILTFCQESFEIFICIYLQAIAPTLTLLDIVCCLSSFIFTLWFYFRIRHRNKVKSNMLQKNYLFTLNSWNNHTLQSLIDNQKINFYYFFQTFVHDVKILYNFFVNNFFFLLVKYPSNNYSKNNKNNKRYVDIIRKYK